MLISGLWLLTVLGAAANFLHQFMAQTLVTPLKRTKGTRGAHAREACEQRHASMSRQSAVDSRGG